MVEGGVPLQLPSWDSTTQVALSAGWGFGVSNLRWRSACVYESGCEVRVEARPRIRVQGEKACDGTLIGFNIKCPW